MLPLLLVTVVAIAIAAPFISDDEDGEVDLYSFYGQPDTTTGERVANWSPYHSVRTLYRV
jgi:hypothetical protein